MLSATIRKHFSLFLANSSQPIFAIGENSYQPMSYNYLPTSQSITINFNYHSYPSTAINIRNEKEPVIIIDNRYYSKWSATFVTLTVTMHY